MIESDTDRSNLDKIFLKKDIAHLNVSDVISCNIEMVLPHKKRFNRISKLMAESFRPSLFYPTGTKKDIKVG